MRAVFAAGTRSMRTLVTGAAGFVGRHTVGRAAGARPRGGRGRQAVEPRAGGARRARCRARCRRPAPAGRRARRGDRRRRRASSTSPRARRARRGRGSTRPCWRRRRLIAGDCARRTGAAAWSTSRPSRCTPSTQLGRGATIDERTPLEPVLGRRDDYAWTKGWQERLVRELSDRGPVRGHDRAARRGPRPGSNVPRAARAADRRAARSCSSAAPPRCRSCRSTTSHRCSSRASSTRAPAGLVLNAVDPDPPRQWAYLQRWLHAQPGRVVVVPVPRALLARRRTGRPPHSRAPSGPRPGGALPDGARPQVVPLRHDDCLAPARVAPAPEPRGGARADVRARTRAGGPEARVCPAGAGGGN